MVREIRWLVIQFWINNVHNLDSTTSERDLGIQIASNLLFKEQVAKAVSKANRMLGLLKISFGSRDETYLKPTMCDEQGKEHVLEKVSTERDLGILIKHKLKWHNQVAHAKNKAYATIGLLKRTLKFWTQESLRILYCPNLEYGSAAWVSYSTEDTNFFESVQKRATKLVPWLKPKYEERLSAIGIQSLATRRKRGNLIQYFKIYKSTGQTQSSCLRGSHLRFARQRVIHCAPREHFLTNRIKDDWNNLPIDIINARSTNNFKNKLDKFNKI